jgi:hypothetical protein
MQERSVAAYTPSLFSSSSLSTHKDMRCGRYCRSAQLIPPSILHLRVGWGGEGVIYRSSHNAAARLP